MSLHLRLILASTLVLAAFLGLTGVALERAFGEAVLASARERMQAEIYGLLAAARIDEEGRLQMPQRLPEGRYATPGSGLYALITSSNGRVLWRSDSLQGLTIHIPPPPLPGDSLFQERVPLAGGGEVMLLAFGVTWEWGNERFRDLAFYVAETRQSLEAELAEFRRSLWGHLALVAVVLLAVQGLILRWGLAPLREVAQELGEVEAGRRQRLGGDYPRELLPLTSDINQLLQSSQERITRYRHTLDDLAHSLKTPLAVLRAGLEARDTPPELLEQLERIDRTVEYQLKRAATAGGSLVVTPIDPERIARRLVAALDKVYHEKEIRFSLEIPEGVRLHLEEGDLNEILGNLLDNACKWCRKRVRLRIASGEEGLVIEVEDDGPGVPPELQQAILHRGVRADEINEGQGLGLAVVREIVEDVLKGRIEIGTGELGGALFRVVIEQPGVVVTR
ncbi:MAG: hypothetical protein D6786_05010 [Gammaproteobacteria bacterium]|nr:MAG: hypothetical protein D6786_05010 [Gammaproteobacteria bacterium]